MQQVELQVADIPLKHFLLLFDAEASIAISAFGDTMHPSSGYVGTEILLDIEKVSQLLKLNYNFDGLVYFQAEIQSVAVAYQAENYTIRGNSKEIAKIKAKANQLSYMDDAPHFEIIAER